MTLTLSLSHSNVRFRADAALLGLALFWGATFVPVKVAVDSYPVFGFIGLRFAFALIVLIPLGLMRLRQTKMTRRQVLYGVVNGAIFLAGYAFQTFGLRYTSAGRAAFITGLNTILVPILVVVLFRERLRVRPVVGALLATMGMAVLGLDGATNGSLFGDLIVLGCAFAFATHVILTGKWGAQCDPVLFTLVQVLTVAPLATIGSLMWEGPFPPIQPAVMQAAAFTGSVVTGLGLLVQVWAQRITTATHTAVILATEPVFGAFFGWILVGEILSGAGFVGCALILAGMLVAESG